MKRRDFIKKGTMAAFAVSTFGFVIGCAKKEAFIGNCETTSDILGPFYRDNSPVRSDLTFPNQDGIVVTIKGKVFAQDCFTALENARVELWHADNDGEYDNNTSDFINRAQWLTDADGNYSFKTILPGRYMNGNQFRPQHFHFRVTLDGYEELISQVYLQGDPYIEDDPWAGDPKAVLRILPIVEESASEKIISFDINLKEQI